MNTGERIKELRTHAGIKQSELAEAIGCTSQVVSNVERGIHFPLSGTPSQSGRFFSCVCRLCSRKNRSKNQHSLRG